MKSQFILLVLLIVFSYSSTFATEPPQKVYSLVKQKRSTDWYKSQSAAWKNVLEHNQTDADAWLNFYTSQRMLKIYNQGVTQQDLDSIVSTIGKAIPNSFEFHYIAHWNSGFRFGDTSVEHLKKAQELSPNRVDLYDDLITYYEVNRDFDQLKTTAKLWYASHDISPGLYLWNYNMLQSTEENAILITTGDNDTYPALVLQLAKNIRDDVSVINSSLMSISSYRNAYFKELGIPSFEKDFDDFDSWTGYQKGMITHLIQHSERPVYFSISTHATLYEDFKDDVYNVGMAYHYCQNKFDNIAVIKKNYEKNYLLDYIQLQPYPDISKEVVEQMNSNYLISMLTLYNHYRESEDDKAQNIRKLINHIAKTNGTEDQVANLINHPSTSPQKSYVISDPKTIEKMVVRIDDSLYAGISEVTNEHYHLFLTDLLRNKRYDDLKIAKAEEVNWRKYLSQDKVKLGDDEIFVNGHPNDDAFPIVNISYQAAQLYCQWLTDTYNSMQHRKKKYSNVTFRLPSEKEWEYIASGGNSSHVYSWGGKYVRNSKGCFIANLNTSESNAIPGVNATVQDCESCNLSDIDGGYFPVFTKSYFPNEFGLYNITGNVAEMTSSANRTKGGSWNTLPKDATIKKHGLNNGPNGEIGFRIIMIVQP